MPSPRKRPVGTRSTTELSKTLDQGIKPTRCHLRTKAVTLERPHAHSHATCARHQRTGELPTSIDLRICSVGTFNDLVGSKNVGRAWAIKWIWLEQIGVRLCNEVVVVVWHTRP